MVKLQEAKQEADYIKKHTMVDHQWGQSDHRAIHSAVIERELSRSWIMGCGHWTDYEEQLFYAIWRPKGKNDYCDVCSKWVKRPPKPRPAKIPNEPGF